MDSAFGSQLPALLSVVFMMSYVITFDRISWRNRRYARLLLRVCRGAASGQLQPPAAPVPQFRVSGVVGLLNRSGLILHGNVRRACQ
jgi:hypothetical protein